MRLNTAETACSVTPAPWEIRKWSWVKYCHGLEQAVPNRSGVYTLAKVKRAFGLPVSMEIVYVGRSVNLRRRYREHNHLYEPNPALSQLADKAEGIEFWFLELPGAELASIEQMLIGSLQPGANRIGVRIPMA